MLNNQNNIVCVGILCADILGKTIDELPEKGRLSIVENVSLEIGGCAANVAIGLAKLGLPAAIVGKIGDDSLGNFARKALDYEKVNVNGLRVDPSVATAASMVMISADGERTILHSLGANQYFCFDDIDLGVIRESNILLVAGTFLMPSFDGEGTVALLKYAQQHGVLCCMDTAWDASGRWMQTIGSALPYLDWFMPSYDEAVHLTGETEATNIAHALTEKGVKNIIIKLDASGCYLKPADASGIFVPAFNNVTAVDCSGAGDSFCAGFLAGLSQGWDLAQCAQFANAVGAHCVRQIGTTAGIRPMNEILRFIQEYEATKVY
jgi:sugar/nucleoside kinase (ribokinase family)